MDTRDEASKSGRCSGATSPEEPDMADDAPSTPTLEVTPAVTSDPGAKDDTTWWKDEPGKELLHSSLSTDSGCEVDFGSSSGCEDSGNSKRSAPPTVQVIPPVEACGQCGREAKGRWCRAGTSSGTPGSARVSQDDIVEVHGSLPDTSDGCRRNGRNRKMDCNECQRPLSSNTIGIIHNVEGQDRVSSSPVFNCEILETASLSEEEAWEVADLPEEPLMGADRDSKAPTPMLLPPLSTRSSSTASMPICRICHLPTGEGGDYLISPCRCSGTMRYVHRSCLTKWLEVSNKRSNKMPACELCQYQYHRHKKFSVTHLQFPSCSTRDKILHLAFIFSLVVMVACATITVLCFKQVRDVPLNLLLKEREIRRVLQNQAELTDTELVTLVCGILFFLAFFVAMYVEVKANHTIYKLVVKFFYMNQQWSIDEYDYRKDCRSGSPVNPA